MSATFLHCKVTFSLCCLFFSHSVLSDSLRPHGLQHARPPSPSPTPGVCSNLMPIELVMPSNNLILCVPLSSCRDLSQHQGLLKWVSSSHQVAKVLEFQLQHQSFQWIIRIDFPQDWLIWSPCSARDSEESFPTPQFKSINFSASAFFMVQLSNPYMTIGKTISLTRRTFVSKVMSLLFNMLSNLVIAFLPRASIF